VEITITPEALANFSPRLLQPWVHNVRPAPTLKAFTKVAVRANAFGR
jgi:hypothetical protein